MEITLKCGEDIISLPVLPSGYEVNYSNNNSEVNITKYGTVNLIGNKNLASTEIESFFPKRKYGFAKNQEYKKPMEYVKKIISWMQEPVMYTVTGTNISHLMTIESFTYSEQDGSGDIHYKLSLKQYEIPKVKVEKKSLTKNSKNINKVTSNRETKKVSSTIYTVKQGDSLSSIARRLTGDADNWRAIYNQNKSVIGGNPNLIKSGQKLVIKV